MTVKFVPLLCAAALALAACETVDDETPQTSVTPTMSVQKRVVHGPIVPDEPVRVAHKRKRTSTYASSHSSTRTAAVAPSSSTPTRVEPVEAPTSEVTAPATTAPTTPSTSATAPTAPTTSADATAPSTTTTPPADATVTTPAPVISEPLPAPTDTAPVEPTPAAESSQPLLPGLDPSRLPELLQMTFAGLPIWLIGLVGLVLVVALAIGFGGRREVEEPI